MEIEPAIDKFMELCQELIDEHHEKNYPSIGVPKLSRAGGRKFLRIGMRVGSFGSSVYCFIALADGKNKNLGSFKQGDIFKAASWKAPAKHARGNVFDESNGVGRMSSYGAAYL